MRLWMLTNKLQTCGQEQGAKAWRDPYILQKLQQNTLKDEQNALKIQSGHKMAKLTKKCYKVKISKVWQMKMEVV